MLRSPFWFTLGELRGFYPAKSIDLTKRCFHSMVTLASIAPLGVWHVAQDLTGCCSQLVYTRANFLQTHLVCNAAERVWFNRNPCEWKIGERRQNWESRNAQHFGRQKSRSESLLKEGAREARMNDAMAKDVQWQRTRWQYGLEILTDKEGEIKQSCWNWHRTVSEIGRTRKNRKTEKGRNKSRDIDYLFWRGERI